MKSKTDVVLINLGPLKVGGGQNVGINFLQALKQLETDNLRFIFTVAKKSDLSLILEKENKFIYYEVPKNPFLRIFYELTVGKAIVYKHKVKVLFSLFGTSFYPRNLYEIMGSADSNLFYPEYDFWNQYGIIKKLGKRVVDSYRIYGLKKADKVVFENKILEQRAKKLFNLSNTIFIKPSVSFNFTKKDFRLPTGIKKNRPIGLFLCGWHHNKNYMMIPEIAKEFRANGEDFYFIITAPNDKSHLCRVFQSKLFEYKLNNLVKIVGNVAKGQLLSLYSKIDYVFLLSNLESFSNNIIEAWYTRKLLIISDEEWAKSICKNSAVYVNQNSSKDIVKKVLFFVRNSKEKEKLVKNGSDRLKKYPSINQKTLKEIEEIKNAFKIL